MSTKKPAPRSKKGLMFVGNPEALVPTMKQLGGSQSELNSPKEGGIVKSAAQGTPDNTGQKQDKRFQPGQSGNPAGRPKGSRNKLGENFIDAFAQDFEQHGAAVIEKVRKERPQDYLKVAASLLPKQMEIEAGRTRPLSELSDGELIELLAGDIEMVVERVLISRGHPPLTIAERQHLQN